MAKNNSNEKPTLIREIIAVFCLFFAAFLLISLVSYNQQSDYAIFRSDSGNWGGAIGYFAAQALTGMIGISSFLLIFILSFFSCHYLFNIDSEKHLPFVLLGSSGLLLASSAIIAVFSCETISIWGHQYPASGLFGRSVYSFVQPFLGKAGYVLSFLLIILLSLMISLNLSIYKTTAFLLDFMKSLKEKRQNSVNNSVKIISDNNTKKSLKNFIRSADSGNVEPRVHEPIKLDVDSETDFTPLPVAEGEFALPSVALLDKPDESTEINVDRDQYLNISKKLEEKLNDFGVVGKVIGISPGPVITTYEFAPAPGVKISKIVSLENDLALCLKKESVRIVGSIPGKAALGIEIPNMKRSMVYIREILGNEQFKKLGAPLTLGLGKDVVGNPVYTNLADMPHLLIAGATGSGKSVGVNTIICSILLNASPEEVRLLMVDPKRIELSAYEAIPHLLHPVVVDPKMASRALQWAVLEMERRYGLMEESRVKNISSYNQTSEEKLPLIVIIIDELADLMMVASKDVETSVARLAQMARAAGMHLILATQRPSVDVLTGLIKANFPTRISFKVSSKIDSRTILDDSGAEHLLGKGDMLFMAPGSSRLQRIHAAYISEAEIDRVVSFLKEQRNPNYDENVLKIAEENHSVDSSDDSENDYDEKYDEAVEFVCESGQASISMVQRRLRVGYNRAARMIELMEKEGIVGPSDGVKPREVLVKKTY